MHGLIVAVFGLLAVGNPQVANSGFEELDPLTALPRNWHFTHLPDQPDLVRYEATTNTGQAAGRALAIHISTNHPQRPVAYNVHQDVAGLTAGQRYRVSAQVKAAKLKTLPMIVVQCLRDGESKPLAYFASPPQKLAADVEQWQRIETEVSVPEGTQAVRLRIGIPGDQNAGGTAFIDDVEIAAL